MLNQSMYQVGIEIPYNLIQSVIYSFIVYILCDYKWTASKFIWFWFVMFLTFLYHTLYGMVSVAMSPNFHIAAVASSGFYILWNIFSGFLIPRPVSLNLIADQFVFRYSNNFRK